MEAKPSSHVINNVDQLLTCDSTTEFNVEDSEEFGEFDDLSDEPSETGCADDTSYNASCSDLAMLKLRDTKTEATITTASTGTTASRGPIFVSNAMKNFLSRNFSDGDVQSSDTSAMLNLAQRSESTEALCPMTAKTARMVHVYQDAPKPASSTMENQPKPNDVLVELAKQQGISVVCPNSNNMPDFFLTVTKNMIANYDLKLMTAVRQGDLLAVQQHATSKLQCCNAFHESIIHTTARRGHAHIMKYLLRDQHLNARVVCDSGRNVLHDACWTGSPNFEMVRLLLEECPDLLWIRDNRNYLPLEYVPKDSWAPWCQFLKENELLILPKTIDFERTTV
jgi:hypothetical protein